MKFDAIQNLSTDVIAPMVHWIRHEKVILDSDLALLYAVETGALNRAVKRNLDRFPADFMFQLSREEVTSRRSDFFKMPDWHLKIRPIRNRLIKNWDESKFKVANDEL